MGRNTFYCKVIIPQGMFEIKTRSHVAGFTLAPPHGILYVLAIHGKSQMMTTSSRIAAHVPLRSALSTAMLQTQLSSILAKFFNSFCGITFQKMFSVPLICCTFCHFSLLFLHHSSQLRLLRPCIDMWF